MADGFEDTIAGDSEAAVTPGRRRFRLPYKLIAAGTGAALLVGVAIGRLTARVRGG